MFSQLVVKKVAKKVAKVIETQSQIIVSGDNDGNNGDSFINKDTLTD